MYIQCHSYMFRPHMGYHQAALVIWGDHCIVHFVLSTLGTSLLFVNLLCRIFSSYFFSGRFTVMYNIYIYISMSLSLSFLYIFRC
jgi:uncharacterized membrane-anchored protein YitT (DUF2179 family)